MIWIRLQPAAEQSEPEPQQGAAAGRGRLLSLLRAPVAAAAAPARAQPPSEIESTIDAIAQLRIQHRAESSGSSEKRGPTMQELEAEAAPIEEEVQEEVVEARVGRAGKRNYLFA